MEHRARARSIAFAAVLALGGCATTSETATTPATAPRPAPQLEPVWRTENLGNSGLVADIPCNIVSEDTPAAGAGAVPTHGGSCALSSTFTFTFTYADRSPIGFVGVTPAVFFNGIAAPVVSAVGGIAGPRTELMIEGHPAVEFIVDHGDTSLRMRAVIVGNRVYQLNVVGSTPELESEIAQRFLTSMHFEPRAYRDISDWQKITPPGAEFSAEFPGQPISNFEEPQDGAVPSLTLFLESITDSRTFAVTRAGPVSDMTRDNAPEHLANGLAHIRQAIGATPVVRDFEYQGWPAQEITVDGNHGLTVRARIYILDKMVYTVQFTGPDDVAASAEVTRFLDSFQHAAPADRAAPPTTPASNRRVGHRH